MGDNAQNIYVALEYKPIRGLFFRLSYTNDIKYNSYDYLRRDIIQIISQKPFKDKIYQNNTFAFDALYEIFNNCFAHINLSYNHAQAYAPTSEAIEAEDRGRNTDGTLLAVGNKLEGNELKAYYLNRYCPVFYQGKNITFTAGLTFSF